MLSPCEAQPNFHPKAVLGLRIQNSTREFLIHWVDLSPAEASWEQEVVLNANFPSFQLEDKLISEAGGDVMVEIPRPPIHNTYKHQNI